MLIINMVDFKERKEKVFETKAKRYFIIGSLAEKGRDFDVSATHYFKSLSAVNDYILSTKNLEAKDHGDRFNLLKENFYTLYKLTSSLFLTYRRAYTKEISQEELKVLRIKLEEAFGHAGIELPTQKKVVEYIKSLLEK